MISVGAHSEISAMWFHPCGGGPWSAALRGWGRGRAWGGRDRREPALSGTGSLTERPVAASEEMWDTRKGCGGWPGPAASRWLPSAVDGTGCQGRVGVWLRGGRWGGLARPLAGCGSLSRRPPDGLGLCLRFSDIVQSRVVEWICERF